MHSTTFLLFLLVSAHALTAGTDAVNRAVRVIAAAQLVAFVFFVIFRALAPRRGGRAPTAPVVGAAGGLP